MPPLLLSTTCLRLWWLDNPGHLHITVIDQADVVRVQVDHLLDRGYRRLAYLALDDAHSRRFIDVRISAFERVFRERGLRTSPVAVEPHNLDAVRTRLEAWSQPSAHPLGLCTWSDVTALAALSGARSLDLDVPGQVGIIGVDDTQAAKLAPPALTSLRLDLGQEAALAAHHVAQALNITTSRPLPREAIHLVQRSFT